YAIRARSIRSATSCIHLSLGIIGMFNAGSDFLMASISPTCGDNLTSQKRLYLTAISFLRTMASQHI
ncbi:MAG: hypothetical protein ACLRMR_07975, partial [Bifidobacterium pseudocatenulatum]